jgi:hypothetical protein
MKKVKVFLVMSSLFFLADCTSKEAPSEVGESVSVEQIKNLPKDDSWNNKLVSFEGYFGFCRKVGVYKAGSKAKLQITTEPYCQGDRIIDTKIKIQRSESTTVFGSAPRNEIVTDEKIDMETLKVITDDYQEVEYQKFIFSGNLIYDSESYYLDNITIHLIK